MRRKNAQDAHPRNQEGLKRPKGTFDFQENPTTLEKFVTSYNPALNYLNIVECRFRRDEPHVQEKLRAFYQCGREPSDAVYTAIGLDLMPVFQVSSSKDSPVYGRNGFFYRIVTSAYSERLDSPAENMILGAGLSRIDKAKVVECLDFMSADVQTINRSKKKKPEDIVEVYFIGAPYDLGCKGASFPNTAHGLLVRFAHQVKANNSHLFPHQGGDYRKND